MAEQVGRGHPDAQPALGQCRLERRHDPIALGRTGAIGDEVVVVQAHAPGAGVGEAMDGVHRIARRAGGLAEGITPGIADRPQPEGEPRPSRVVCVRHRCHSLT
jgi:hypothetical protein